MDIDDNCIELAFTIKTEKPTMKIGESIFILNKMLRAVLFFIKIIKKYS